MRANGRLLMPLSPIADETQTIASIRKRFGSDAGQYLREKVTVAKAAVRGLHGRMLAALGVTVTEPEDITPADSDLDQLVETLLAAPPAPGP